MGRHYKGLDHEKVTVKLDNNLADIVGRYAERHSINKSTAIRYAIIVMGLLEEKADLFENHCANLLDIAKVFDNIKGPTAPVYANALREAALVLWALSDKKTWKEALQ